MNNQQPNWNQYASQSQQSIPYLQQIAAQYEPQNPFAYSTYTAGVHAGAWGLHSSEQRSTPGSYDVPGSSLRDLSTHMRASLTAANGGRIGRPFALSTAFTDPANQHFGTSSPMETRDLRDGVTKYKLDQIPSHLHPDPMALNEQPYEPGNCGEFSTLYQAAVRSHPGEKFNIVWACSIQTSNPRTPMKFCSHCRSYATNLVADMPGLVIVDIARRGYEIYASNNTISTPGYKEEVENHVNYYKQFYKESPGPHSVTEVACPCSSSSERRGKDQRISHWTESGKQQGTEDAASRGLWSSRQY